MELIHTKDYLLLINEEAEIEHPSYYYYKHFEKDVISHTNTIEKGLNTLENLNDKDKFYKKIIAYYPLTKEAKELDLPLLPKFEQKVDIEELAKEYSKNKSSSSVFKEAHEKDFIEGYKAAQSKQFSLEDVKKAYNAGFSRGCAFIEANEVSEDVPNSILKEEEIIQSLSTQQLPKEFEPKGYFEMPHESNEFKESYKFQTITNSEGKQELVGIYK